MLRIWWSRQNTLKPFMCCSCESRRSSSCATGVYRFRHTPARKQEGSRPCASCAPVLLNTESPPTSHDLTFKHVARAGKGRDDRGVACHVRRALAPDHPAGAETLRGPLRASVCTLRVPTLLIAFGGLCSSRAVSACYLSAQRIKGVGLFETFIRYVWDSVGARIL